ncbi:MAG: cobalamin-binding protein [Kiritimatiellae bacterium]|nr:cobalamin-binding protein [Kiritimatiellia bacterium]MDW8459224.1 cobalamin-binding protein [Verrucomicrobiota bacterium]
MTDTARIVTLFPAATEMVCAIGLAHALVGVSHECDHPAWVAQYPRVTRSRLPAGATSAEIDRFVRECAHAGEPLYDLDEKLIADLRPSLIVAQALCGVCAVSEGAVSSLAKRLSPPPHVLFLQPSRLDDVLAGMQALGEAAGATFGAQAAVDALRARISAIRARTDDLSARPRVAFLEWLDPPFCAGHWTPELVRLAGGVNVLGEEGCPSRRVGWDEIASAKPDVLAIACCGYSPDQARADWGRISSRPDMQSIPAVRDGHVLFFDGSQFFNRPGPRLVDSLEHLARALHPGLFADLSLHRDTAIR